MNDIEICEYLIENNNHLVLATADTEGKPWISPLFFAYDTSYNTYWVSDKSARHSENIRSRPEVSISIFCPVPPDNVFDGIYIDAEAAELTEERDILEAISVLQARPQSSKFMVSDISNVTGDASWRIYKAAPQEINKRSDAVCPKTGQAITIRKVVSLL